MSRSRRRKKAAEAESNNERWLITYSDLITLLMVFFVLMYSMSQVDIAKYSAVANSLSLVLTGQSMSMMEAPGPSMAEGLSSSDQAAAAVAAAANQAQMEEIEAIITKFIETRDSQISSSGSNDAATTRLSEQIIIYEQERGLVISFKDALLFGSGSSDLTPVAREIIKEVGKPLVGIPNYIRVEGHTDDLPINTSKFPSNWELSVMRATNVVHVLNEASGISADRLAAIGYGQNRPLVLNDSDKHRAMNRRVDLVILKKQYDYFEPPRM
ncbi:flagellar motor rotation protein motb [hydrocarbon metagenome]|uniref:Flagellar motor rotation protein motb n=1 Tax=hydrocarbon metagenome TaxID=938273 RepID=A0A0W8E6N3_9ZZZZ